MERFTDIVVEYAPKIIGAAAFLLVAYFICGWIGSLVHRAMQRAKVEKTLSIFLGNIARWGLMIMSLIACLGIFGVETTSFAALIGASALAIGLAFQGSLSNLAAGVMLLIFRPFKVDDAISVVGQLGKVESISLFNTHIDTFDNRRIIIPNGAIFGSTIENLTHHATRRVDVSVGVEYSADLDQTRQVLTAAATALPGRLDSPEPQVLLLELGDSSVNWTVRVWANTSDYWTLRDALTRAVKVALDQAGLGIPFPQMDVHFDTPPGGRAVGLPAAH